MAKIDVRFGPTRHDTELFIDGKPAPFVDLAVTFKGRRRVLQVTFGKFRVLVQSDCPERNRFDKVLQAKGDSSKIAALEPVCSMIRHNPHACDGCPKYPL